MAIKMKVTPMEIEGREEEEVQMRIPTDAKTPLKFGIGDSVTVEIKGRVKMIHAEDEEDAYREPGSICLVVDSISVDGKNAFEDLIDD